MTRSIENPELSFVEATLSARHDKPRQLTCHLEAEDGSRVDLSLHDLLEILLLAENRWQVPILDADWWLNANVRRPASSPTPTYKVDLFGAALFSIARLQDQREFLLPLEALLRCLRTAENAGLIPQLPESFDE